MKNRYLTLILFLIIFTALGVRLYTALTCRAVPDFSDMARYSEAAQGNQLIPSSLPPGYPLFLRVIYLTCGDQNFSAVYAAQAVLSALTVLLLYWITARLKDQKTALLAAGIAALYPNFIAYNLTILTETVGLLFTSLLLAIFLIPVSEKKKSLGSVLLLCLGCGFRPVMIFFAPGLFLALKKRKVFLLALAAVLAPYFIYSALNGGISNRAGRAFYKTYNPASTGDRYLKLKETELRRSDMTGWEYYRAGLSFIKNNKLKTADIIYNKSRLVFARGWDAFVLRPVIGSSRHLSQILIYAYLPLMLCGFAGMVRLRDRRYRFLALLLISYLACNIFLAIFKVRYRLMVEPILIIYTALLLSGHLRGRTFPRPGWGSIRRWGVTLIGRSGAEERPRAPEFFRRYTGDWDILLIVFLLALTLRLYPAITANQPADSTLLKYYNQLAVQGGFTPTQPPLYPLFLRVIYLLAGTFNYRAVYIVQGIINSVAVLLLYGITAGLCDRRAGLAAALMGALYPNFIFYCLEIKPESLVIFLVILFSTLALVRIKKECQALLFAALTAGGLLLKPVLVWLLPGTFVLNRKRKLYLIIFMLILIPLVIQRINRYHKAVPVFEGRLYELNLKNYTTARDGWDIINRLYSNTARLTEKGWHFIKSWPDENTRNTTYARGYSYVLIMLGGLVGLAAYYRRGQRPLLLPVGVYLVLLILFTKFKSDFRVVIEPLFIAYSGILVSKASRSWDGDKFKALWRPGRAGTGQPGTVPAKSGPEVGNPGTETGNPGTETG
ncbi:MAG: glycosyltransferase family 39 protein [Candidatus Krumholzibacteriota bacterium]|nr:glycosyltransferase family 39 protein [Candidatus Krumholzibacteriota bacterium]